MDKEVEKVKKAMEDAAGYDLSTLRKRVNNGAYDALQVLKEVEHLATKSFFNKHFSILPHDFVRKPKKG